jgi:hypothetical protein
MKASGNMSVGLRALYLLRNYMWCGKCSHRCVTHRTTHRGGKVYGQYRCGNFDNKPPHTRYCYAPGIGQVVLETAAWAMIWESADEPRAAARNGAGIL